jgi:hypothetical protein
MRTLGILPLLVAALPVLATEIPSGSHMLLRLENSVNTKTAREGDYVYLRTASPIVVNNRIIVPAQSYVQGVVSHTKQSGRVKGRAELSIRLETLTLPAGTVYKISPRLASVDSENTGQQVEGKENEIKQGGTKLKDAGRIAILAGTGAAIGGLADRSVSAAGIGAGAGGAVGLATVLLTRGSEVRLNRGATLDIVFDRPVLLE